jgi:hypothetical protein
MSTSTPRPRRPARLGRWAASGLTAAVAVGSVGAMAEAAETNVTNTDGDAFGATARYRGEIAAAAMMTAADAGDERPVPRPPRIGSAGVS